MKKLLALIFFVLISNYCDAQPKWITATKSDAEYYYGIGGANKIAEPLDYQQSAKSKALAFISSEIVVIIENEFRSVKVELNEDIRTETINQIKSSTVQELDGYEQVDSWESETEYWVLYRLSKNFYLTKKAEKIFRAREASILLLKEGEHFEHAKEYSNAIRNYGLAIIPLMRYPTEQFTYEVDARSYNLKTYLTKRLDDLLKKVHMQPIQQLTLKRAFQNIHDTLSVFITIRENEKNYPVRDMPLSAGFLIGSGDISSKIRSSVTGEGMFILRKISSNLNSQKLRIEVDYAELFNGAENRNTIEKCTGLLPSRAIEIALNIKSLEIAVCSQVKNLDTLSTVDYIADVTRSSISALGFRVGSIADSADYSITINGNTRLGANLYGQFISYADINLSIVRISDMKQLYYRDFNNIKGVQLDSRSAGLKAIENCSLIINKEVKAQITTILTDR